MDDQIKIFYTNIQAECSFCNLILLCSVCSANLTAYDLDCIMPVLEFRLVKPLYTRSLTRPQAYNLE